MYIKCLVACFCRYVTEVVYTSRNSKFPIGLYLFRSRKTLIFVSLLFMVTLTSCCLLSEFNSVSPFVLGTPDKVVNNETELRDAINNAPNKKSHTIAINTDITLCSSLVIPANKDITLTSNKALGHYKLIGPYGDTLTVEERGLLKLDGVIITHESNVLGRGITVNSGGTLIMYRGEISGNSAIGVYWGVGGPSSAGGGVYITYPAGVFEMYGGKISDNYAINGEGGGVNNGGTFRMFGGEIVNNHATFITNTVDHGFGGGVYNAGTFEKYGGTISGNTAHFGDGNVYHTGSGSPGGDGGSSNGGGSGSGGDGESSNGDGGISKGDGYSLKYVIIICVGVVGLVVGVVAVALFFYFGRRMKQMETKFNALSQGKVEE